MSLRRAEQRNNPLMSASSSLVCEHCMSTRIVISQGPEWARAQRCRHCSPSCETCEDTGFVFERNRYGSMDSLHCPDCTPLRRQISLYNAAEIPRRYADAKINDFQYGDDPMLRALTLDVRRMLDQFKPGDRGFGLSGGVGNGKTFLMASFLRFMTLQREIPGRFVEFSHLLSDIRAGYDANRSEAEIISHLVDVPILVIDELGKSLKTEWQIAILDELISRRYNRAVSTFFTTNFPLAAPAVASRNMARDDFKITSLEERIGSRMFSRLCEMCTFYTFTAPDRRRATGGGLGPRG